MAVGSSCLLLRFRDRDYNSHNRNNGISSSNNRLKRYTMKPQQILLEECMRWRRLRFGLSCLIIRSWRRTSGFGFRAYDLTMKYLSLFQQTRTNQIIISNTHTPVISPIPIAPLRL